MSDTLKELLSVFDLPEEMAEKPIDDIKTAFHEKWVNRSLADSDPDIRSKITGKVLGSIQTLATREFGLEQSEVKDLKKVEDFITLGASKYKRQLEEANEQLKSGGGDAAKWQEKLDKLKGESKQYKEMADKLKQTLEEKETEWTVALKKTKLDYAIGALKDNLPYAEEFTKDALRKKGFEAHINETYNFDFNEQEELIVTNKKGELVVNESKNGHFSPEDLLKTELKKHNGLKIPGTDTTRRPVDNNNRRTEPPKPIVAGGQERKLPANLRKRLGEE